MVDCILDAVNHHTSEVNGVPWGDEWADGVFDYGDDLARRSINDRRVAVAHMW